MIKRESKNWTVVLEQQRFKILDAFSPKSVYQMAPVFLFVFVELPFTETIVDHLVEGKRK